jgi:small subunit ribosomal protein S17
MKRRLKGKVISAKSNKTVTVEIERKKIHPIYRKRYTSSKKFQVHDEIGVAENDYVVIEETRPISKTKKWIVVKKVSEKEEV